MIHYHGTPCGGTREEAARFLSGRHALVPFPNPEDLPAVGEVCQSFVFDNGAFSVWKRGLSLDVAGYIEWCSAWCRHPGFDWAIIPDVIEGTEEQNDLLLGIWPADIPGAPVWHLHESLDRLEHLASSYRVVCLGSSGQWATPGEESWWERISEAMERVCPDGRPLCRLHGLRMLDQAIFHRLPLASADSTNAARNSCNYDRFGQYAPPTRASRMNVIADRIEAHQSAAVWVPRAKQRTLAWA